MASPGDLDKERKIIQETVARINRRIGKLLKWFIILDCWEDTPPGFSRPQSIINPNVDTCDLFLGMLWRWWGSPTGTHTSGFHEEFTRARERKKATGKPEIWIFFKTIENDHMKDPGPQLKQVLKFKKELKKQHELLFREFEDISEWKILISEFLTTYVIKFEQIQQQVLPIEQSHVIKQERVVTNLKEPKDSKTRESYPLEITKLLKKLESRVINEGSNILNFTDRSRLLLLTTSWFSEDYSWKILGVHEINIIYRHRKEWTLAPEEFSLLHRTIISDKNDTKPGWFWLRNMNEKLVDTILCVYALQNPNVKVRGGALHLLINCRFQAPRKFLEKALNDQNEQNVKQAIKLLRIGEKKENLDLLNQFSNSNVSSLREMADDARIELMFLDDNNKGFTEVLNSGRRLPTLMLTESDWMNANIDKLLLHQALDASEPSIRRFAIHYLRKAKMLSKVICEKLLEDQHLDVKKEAILGLLELGEHIPLGFVTNVLKEAFYESVNEILYEVSRRRNPKELLSVMSWYTSHGSIAYRVLALEHFEMIKSRIRKDLEQEFENLISESENRIVEEFGEQAIPIIKDWKESKLQDFTKANYIAAALAGLFRHGHQEDVKFARRFIGNTYLRIADMEAIRLLAKFGDSSDVEKLLETAFYSYGEKKTMAANAALELSSDIEDVISKMLISDDQEIAAIAVRALHKVQMEQKTQLLKSLLSSKNENLRLIGLAVIVNENNEKDLEKLLDEYLNKSPYYYNVVTWLDRYLYAPGRYNKYFKGKLLSYLNKEDKKEHFT